MQILKAKGVGKSFFVYKYADIDISLPRTESKTANGHRGFTVGLATDAKQACKRRDFTINALMYDLKTQSIVDFFGGLDDIENKILKIVDHNSFAEDSLRVLRAMQFSARLGFKIDANSIMLMQKMDLDDLSNERVFNEFEKMFYAPKLHYGLYYMLRLCVAKKLFASEITFAKFLFYAKALHQDFNPKSYHYMFIYHLKRDFNFSKLQTLPKHYLKALQQPLLPKNVTKRYVAAVATRYKIEDYLGNYSKKVIQYAKELDVYQKKFIACDPLVLKAQGLKGDAIKSTIKEKNIQAIRAIKEQ